MAVIAFAMRIGKKGTGVGLVGAKAMKAEGRVLQRSLETHFFMSSFQHESVGSPRQEVVSALLIWKFWCQKQCFVVIVQQVVRKWLASLYNECMNGPASLAS